ncbi:MAG: toxic anion resistance protein [Deltaproteobacteria bacterium]|jgi:uncharacterized protein YaaN involved in tellurite resistance|nr:toxic anion resistance protein [Deltaproteobacteria bacterium]
MALFSLTVSDAEDVRKEIGAAPQEADPAEAARRQARDSAAADPALADAAARNAELVVQADPLNPDSRTKIINVIEKFGLESMKLSAEKAKLLTSSTGELSRAGEGGGMAAQALGALGDAVRSLDPAEVDFDAKGFLGFFSPAKAYFKKFGGFDDTIAELSRSMAQSQGSLKNDNITINLERTKLMEANKNLRREIALGLILDDEICRRLDPIKASGSDPDRVHFIEQDVLFPLRQRIIDLQQTLAVNNQGLVAMEVVSRNNSELIRGVDRALTVTLAALRTSAAVAGALYNQKIALKKLKELDSAANAAAAGAAFAGPGGGSSQATVERLKESFRDVMSSFDEIDRFRNGAVASMQDSVRRFKNLAETGQAEVDRIQSGNLG